MKFIFENTNRKKLSLFTTAGFPHLNSLNTHLELFEAKGVDFVEVGIPFSDPIADGPTIQESSRIALENGMNLNLLFEQIASRKTKIPLVLMGYLNPILQFGLDSFLEEAKKCKISGLVLPDLSIDLYKNRYKKIFDKFDIPLCFLVTPSTADDRIQESAKLSRNGFIYLVSSNSTTGSKISSTADSNNIHKRYSEIKSLCGSTPVMIGFGINNKENFDNKTQSVDGGIIGSAFIRATSRGNDEFFIDEIIRR